MPENTTAGPSRLSSAEFLAAIERWGVLPDAKQRAVQERFARRPNLDSLALAHQLIEDGTLTEFQAHRLLRGKKRLAFGRYVLLDHVGQGARGGVFKARHRLMDRVVALKVLSPDRALSHSAVGRFFREMKLVALVDHPNVVRAIDADVDDGCPYIVMEFLDGDDLEHVLARRGPLPPDDVISYMAQSARGLAHAHEKGVIHRDVKPTNLFLVKGGVVKVLDLGFGELVGMSQQTADVFDTDENIVVGTTDFMSPEQVKQKAIDARTDLFSLGCTMYRLLTATYAFPGVTPEDRLIKRLHEQHVPITDVRPRLSSGLVAILDRLLALRPDDRFGSADEAEKALEALMQAAAPSERGTNAKPATKPTDAGGAALGQEFEPPLDWLMIETALRPSGHATPQAPRGPGGDERKTRPAHRLSAHRSSLEEEGGETGRELQKKYRDELIQLKRTMAEHRSEATEEEPRPPYADSLERIGEQIGDFLAEPNARLIVIAVVLVLLVLALVIAMALV
jgi:serine/threonine-protein kinase